MNASKIFEFIKILFSICCVCCGYYLVSNGFVSNSSPFIIRFLPVFLMLIGVCVVVSLFKFDNNEEDKK